MDQEKLINDMKMQESKINEMDNHIKLQEYKIKVMNNYLNNYSSFAMEFVVEYLTFCKNNKLLKALADSLDIKTHGRLKLFINENNHRNRLNKLSPEEEIKILLDLIYNSNLITKLSNNYNLSVDIEKKQFKWNDLMYIMKNQFESKENQLMPIQSSLLILYEAYEELMDLDIKMPDEIFIGILKNALNSRTKKFICLMDEFYIQDRKLDFASIDLNNLQDTHTSFKIIIDKQKGDYYLEFDNLLIPVNKDIKKPFELLKNKITLLKAIEKSTSQNGKKERESIIDAYSKLSQSLLGLIKSLSAGSCSICNKGYKKDKKHKKVCHNCHKLASEIANFNKSEATSVIKYLKNKVKRQKYLIKIHRNVTKNLQIDPVQKSFLLNEIETLIK